MVDRADSDATTTGEGFPRDSGAAPRHHGGRTRGTGTTRRVWELAWPVIVTNLAQNVGGLVSLAVVSQALGPEGIAARNVGMRVFFTLEVFVMAIATGTTALVARAWGAGDRAEAERVGRTSLWLSLGVAGLITFPVIASADTLVGIFDLDANTADMAATFVRWSAAGTLVFAVNFIPMASLRAAGDTVRPMFFGLLTSAIGISTIYLFVGGAFGAPRLGMDGVGLSMLSSFAASGLRCWCCGGSGGSSLAGDRRAIPSTARASACS